jgi:pre-rRNA-processing protein TSR4
MPSDDGWSDSDDEGLSDVETSVLLGVPDGPVEQSKDLLDAAVSRIGGHPVRASLSLCNSVIEYDRTSPQAFLTADPPVSSSHCKSCSQPMELLVQVWCPFEESPMDRSLYIWGCAQGKCQRKEGR